jgi:hypothetical protein
MKSKWKALLGVAVALVLNAAFASAALAHGGVPDGHTGSEQALGGDWSFLLLPPEYVLGGVTFLGMLYAVTRLRG